MSWEQAPQVGGEGNEPPTFAPGMWVIDEEEPATACVDSKAKESSGGPEWGVAGSISYEACGDRSWMGQWPGFEYEAVTPSSVVNDFYALQAANTMPPAQACLDYCGDALDSSEFAGDDFGINGPPMGAPLGMATVHRTSESDADAAAVSSVSGPDGWSEAAAAAGWYWPNVNNWQDPNSAGGEWNEQWPEWEDGFDGSSFCGMTGPGGKGDSEFGSQAASDSWAVGSSSKAKTSKATRGQNACRSHSFVPRKADLMEQFQEHVEAGQKVTTLMIRNVPNKYTRTNLMQEINSLGFEGAYDFLYLPVDTATKWNVGYAFVNFEEPEDAQRFVQLADGHEFQLYGSKRKRLAQVANAHIQGLERNLTHLDGKSVFNMSHPDFRPWVKHMPEIFAEGCDVGEEFCFTQRMGYLAEHGFDFVDDVRYDNPVKSFWELQEEAEQDLAKQIQEGNINSDWALQFQDHISTEMFHELFMGQSDEVEHVTQQPEEPPLPQAAPLPAESVAPPVDRVPGMEDPAPPKELSTRAAKRARMRERKKREAAEREEQERLKQQQQSAAPSPTSIDPPVADPHQGVPAPSVEKRTVEEEEAAHNSFLTVVDCAETVMKEGVTAFTTGLPLFRPSVPAELRSRGLAVRRFKTSASQRLEVFATCSSSSRQHAGTRRRRPSLKSFWSMDVSVPVATFAIPSGVTASPPAPSALPASSDSAIVVESTPVLTEPTVEQTDPSLLVPHVQDQGLDYASQAQVGGSSSSTASPSSCPQGAHPPETSVPSSRLAVSMEERKVAEAAAAELAAPRAEPALGVASPACTLGPIGHDVEVNFATRRQTKVAAIGGPSPNRSVQAREDRESSRPRNRSRHHEERQISQPLLDHVWEDPASAPAPPGILYPRRSMTRSPSRPGPQMPRSSWEPLPSEHTFRGYRDFSPDRRQPHWDLQTQRRPRSLSQTPAANRNSSKHQRRTAKSARRYRMRMHTDGSGLVSGMSDHPTASLSNSCALAPGAWQGDGSFEVFGGGCAVDLSYAEWPPPPRHMLGGEHEEWSGSILTNDCANTMPCAASPVTHVSHYDVRLCYMCPELSFGPQCWNQITTEAEDKALTSANNDQDAVATETVPASTTNINDVHGQQVVSADKSEATVEVAVEDVPEQIPFSLDIICGAYVDDRGTVYEIIKDKPKTTGGSGEEELLLEEMRSCTVIAVASDGRKIYTERLIRDQTEAGSPEPLISFGRSYLLDFENFDAATLRWTPRPGSSGKEFFWTRDQGSEARHGAAAKECEPTEAAKSSLKDETAADDAGAAAQDTHHTPTEAFMSQDDGKSTTLMVRCLPTDFSQDTLLAELAFLGLNGTFDYIYMPTDMGTPLNIGCAFMNFKTVEDYIFARNTLSGHEWQHCAQGAAARSTRRKAEVASAIIQGRDENMLHYCLTMQQDNGLAAGPPPLVFLQDGTAVNVSWDLLDPNSGTVSLPHWHASTSAAMQDWMHAPAEASNCVPAMESIKAEARGEVEQPISKQDTFPLTLGPYWEMQPDAEKESLSMAVGARDHSSSGRRATADDRAGRDSAVCASRTPSPPMQMQGYPPTSSIDWQALSISGQGFTAAAAELGVEGPTPAPALATSPAQGPAAAASKLAPSGAQPRNRAAHGNADHRTMSRTPSPPIVYTEFLPMTGFPTTMAPMGALAKPTEPPLALPPPPPPPPMPPVLTSLTDQVLPISPSGKARMSRQAPVGTRLQAGQPADKSGRSADEHCDPRLEMHRSSNPRGAARSQLAPGCERHQQHLKPVTGQLIGAGFNSGLVVHAHAAPLVGAAVTSGTDGAMCSFNSAGESGSEHGESAPRSRIEADACRARQAQRNGSPSPPSQPPLGLEWPTLGDKQPARARASSRGRTGTSVPRTSGEAHRHKRERSRRSLHRLV